MGICVGDLIATRRYTLVHGFCFFKLLFIGPKELSQCQKLFAYLGPCRSHPALVVIPEVFHLDVGDVNPTGTSMNIDV